jgi:hypothetical protein
MRRSALLAVPLTLLLSSPPASQAQTPTPAPAPAPAAPASPATPTVAPLRLAVLGASVSDGFGCRLQEARDDGEYAAEFRMTTMLQLACPELPLATFDGASSTMFLGAKRTGGETAAAARAFGAEAVVAIDYLFWFCYGSHKAPTPDGDHEAARLEVLEAGLAELAQFKVPVVVGNIPDMSRAVGKLLRKSQMPPLESIARANERIAAWAKDQPHVHVVPLAKLIAQLHDEQAVDVAGKRFEATPAAPLLLRDDLHAAPAGLAAIACVALHTLQQALPDRAFGQLDPAATLARAKQTMKKLPPPANQPSRGDGK